MRDQNENLRIETAGMLTESGKTAADVRFVIFGKGPFYCSWEEFAAAANFEYDSGFGSNEVDGNLKIVGDDWWLERGEYDGSEWWEFKTLPTKPEKHRAPISDDLKDTT
jgi:hypothetical protein